MTPRAWIVVGLVAVAIVVLTATAEWALRPNGVRDSYECRREVAMMGYNEGHSRFPIVWMACMAARGYSREQAAPLRP